MEERIKKVLKGLMKLLALKNGEIEVLKRACLNPKQESEIEALLKEAETVLNQASSKPFTLASVAFKMRTYTGVL